MIAELEANNQPMCSGGDVGSYRGGSGGGGGHYRCGNVGDGEH
jgi:hypothetical protein